MQNVENFILLGALVILTASIWYYIRQFTTKSACPFCGNNHDLERIKSAAIYKSIPLINTKHFICYKCNKKHYKINLQSEVKLVKTKV